MNLDYATLYREYKDYMFRFIRRKCPSDEEAEELVQNTFVRVLTTKTEFRGDCNIRTWLTTILLREHAHSFTRMLRRGHAVTVSEEVVDSERYDTQAVADTFDIVLRHEQLALLDEAASKMSATDQALYERVMVDDEPYADVAADLHMPIGTVRSSIFRVRRKLEHRIGRA